MDKKLFMRRVAILLALVVGILQMQIGGAVTANSYTGALSAGQNRADRLGGGSIDNNGSANIDGTLGATVNVTSVGDFGSRNQCLLTSSGSGCAGFAIGANEARRTSRVYHNFGQFQTGTYTATITVNVAGVSTPTANADYSSGLNECTFNDAPVGEEPVVSVCPGGTGASNPSTNQYAYASGVRGSDADASLSIAGSAFAVRLSSADFPRDENDVITDAPGYAVKYNGLYGSQFGTGTTTLVISFTLGKPGPVQVALELTAHAWAAGAGSASTGGHLQVTSIEVS